MNFRAIDDPALLLPRVMDVRGTLQRLGFAPCVYKGERFYRLNVLLFYPVESKLCRRAISHVSLSATVFDCYTDPRYSEEFRLHVWAYYGYPTKRTRGHRIVTDFKSLATEEQFEYVIRKDSDLLATESVLRQAIENIRTKKINRTFMDDDLNEREMPGWEALECAVRSDLHKKNNIWKPPRLRSEDSWWDISVPKPHVDAGFHKLRVKPRLPNFDRGQLRGLVRR